MIRGLHHVTAIARDPQTNVDFYAGVLGLALVKKTVNYDDPSTYHLYYGVDGGRPGTLLTFFPWAGGRPAQPGKGQAIRTMLSVPEGALEYWELRLSTLGVEVHAGAGSTLNFRDPDGLALGLIAADPPGEDDGPIPGEFAIRSLHGVLLASAQPDETRALLTSVLKFGVGDRALVAGEDPTRNWTLLLPPGIEAPRGRMGAGAIHHIAFRVADDDALAEWRRRLIAADLEVTDVRDRTYFRSIYFREPGEILLELATDPPGFAVDEPAEALGRRLCLPAWLEERRDELEDSLPPLYVPR